MRNGRILMVTAGLMLAGAVFGTIAGMVVLAAWLLSIGQGKFLFSTGDAFIFAVIFGGTLGAVMGPIAAWVLMRHVPLGLAVGGTTLGTLVSGGIGLFVAGNPWVAMFWGMTGFGITAIGLRIRFPRGGRSLLRG